MKKEKINVRIRPANVTHEEFIISEIITKYMNEIYVENKDIKKPDIKFSSIGRYIVYLRTGKQLLAIYRLRTGKFVPLTNELIIKHSL